MNKDVFGNGNGNGFLPMTPRRDGRIPGRKVAQRAQMGDFMQFTEPFQRHWETLPGNVKMPGPAAIAMPPVPLNEQKVVEQQVQANQIAQAMACQVQPVKRGYWVEPPSEAIIVDQSTIASGIAIPANGALTTILQVVIPDRFYGVVSQFGHELETDTAFQQVQWQIMVNDSPLPFSYYDGTNVIPGAFRAQLGKANTPTVLACPIIAKYGDTIYLKAQSVNGAGHTAYARFCGWMYAVKELDGAGSVQESCQYTGVVPLLRSGGTGQTLY